MRIIVQRVKRASVLINNKMHCQIKNGLLCYVGFSDYDSNSDFEWASNKLLKLKLFNQKMSLQDVNGELLIVSQFTLFASVKKGQNPSWSRAAKPDLAKKLYTNFITICKQKFTNGIQTGVFGSDMQVESINNGPFTLFLDTKNKE